MVDKIDKGNSMLNATDEMANPYGLILSEREREIICGMLNKIDRRTNALLEGKTGWKQQIHALFSAAWQLGVICFAAIVLSYFFNTPRMYAFLIVVAFVILQKLNLLLSHERSEDTDARIDREDVMEAKRRARYFKDMRCNDMSVEK